MRRSAAPAWAAPGTTRLSGGDAWPKMRAFPEAFRYSPADLRFIREKGLYDYAP